jgi:hypothetical protein
LTIFLSGNISFLASFPIAIKFQLGFIFLNSEAASEKIWYPFA